ncbi:MAG: DNA alkylation repair protein, partial [bacterium]
AIRPFMITHTDKMMEVLNNWVKDPNEHIRRLAAEGSRPRGVWVAHIEAFKKDPRPVLKLLEHLKGDESLYVRKAVANNLNDITKDHPDLVIKTAIRWLKDKNPNTDWIIKHACRTLIKKGDPRVFPLFGFTTNPKIKLKGLNTSHKIIKYGSEIILDFEIQSFSDKSQKLAVDYKFHFVKKNGKTAPKTFKLSEKNIRGNEILKLKIKYLFKDFSTRKHYPGIHKIEIIVNGQSYKEVTFEVIK